MTRSTALGMLAQGNTGSEILQILDEYERIADKHGPQYLNTIMDKIERGLENVSWQSMCPTVLIYVSHIQGYV